jgi:hypothetical protein
MLEKDAKRDKLKNGQKNVHTVNPLIFQVIIELNIQLY